jgi:hypothetical protein
VLCGPVDVLAVVDSVVGNVGKAMVRFVASAEEDAGGPAWRELGRGDGGAGA